MTSPIHKDPSKADSLSKRPLSSLRPGEEGWVESIDTTPEVRFKLMEMGFIPGELVRVIRQAPFGDPLEIELLHYRLAIRRSEAENIYLKSTSKNY